MKKTASLLIVVLSLFGTQLLSQERNIVFPADAGVIDVTKAPYFADNTGQEDATAIIQKAMDDHPNGDRIIYLPAGTYLVSDRIDWPAGSGGNTHKRTSLQGQGKDKTIIKLQDNCPGYQDPANRKAVVWTGLAPAQRFRNSIYDLTVNTGTGNPGASGIQFNCSNEGTMQHVNIVSEDGQGVFGLDLSFTDEIGPGYIYDITVDGFLVGIRQGSAINSMTFEKITLRNQKLYGFENERNVSVIRGLVSENTVTAVRNGTSPAVMVLVDAQINGGTSNIPAVSNGATLYVRNLAVSGDYKQSIASISGLGLNISNMNVAEYSSHQRLSIFPSPNKMLNLEIKDRPDIAWPDTTQWVNPMDFGAVGDGSQDDTPAIQAAIDAGKELVYFPGGKSFKIEDTLRIRGTVTHIMGCESRLSGTGTILFEDGASPAVFLQRVNGLYHTVDLVHASSRTLIFDSSTGINISSRGTGDFLIYNVAIGTIRLLNPEQKVWGRQINVEDAAETNIINDGATFWLMGLKTERGNIKLATLNGGKSEVLGVHNYSTSGAKTTPYFDVVDSHFSVAGYRETHYSTNPYNDYIRETRGSEVKVLTRNLSPAGGAGQGKMVPLFSGFPITTDIPDKLQNPLARKTSIIQHNLSWTESDNSDFEYYNVYYTLVAGGPYILMATFLEQNSFEHNFQIPYDYIYMVTQVDKHGVESPNSDEFKALDPSLIPPDKPKNLDAYVINGNVYLQWEPNKEENLDGYNLYRSLEHGTGFSKVDELIRDTFYLDSNTGDQTVLYYQLTAIDTNNNESDFSNQVMVDVVTHADALQLNDMKIYPNPANDFILIQLPKGLKQSVKVTIYDLAGNKILMSDIFGDENKIDISHIHNGVYFINLQQKDKISVQKFMITR